MKHLTPSQLQEYSDGHIDAELDMHVRQCDDCRSRLQAFRQLERALKNVPLERTSENFTMKVMGRLGISEQQSFAWSVLKNLAPLVALTLIVGVIVLAMKFSGASQSQSAGKSAEATQSLYNVIGGGYTSAITSFNGWMAKYFSFAFTKSSSGLTIFLILFFIAIALLDRFFIMPYLKKKGSMLRL